MNSFGWDGWQPSEENANDAVMFLQREERTAPEALYARARRLMNEGHYHRAAEEFKKLTGVAYRDADKWYSCAEAALECKNGFWGRAYHIFRSLGTFNNSNQLADALEKRMRSYNGSYKSADTFLSNYLFIRDGQVAVEASYFYEGKINFLYDMCWGERGISCEAAPEFVFNGAACYEMSFNKEFTAAKLQAAGGLDGFSGLYYRMNPLDAPIL